MDRVRMVRKHVVCYRAGIAQKTAEKEQTENEPVVGVSGGIMFFRVRIVDERKEEHPERGEEVAVDIAGFVVDV